MDSYVNLTIEFRENNGKILKAFLNATRTKVKKSYKKICFSSGFLPEKHFLKNESFFSLMFNFDLWAYKGPRKECGNFPPLLSNSAANFKEESI